jgi:uncharacterized protein
MAIKINDIPPEGITLEIARTIDLFETGTADTAFSASVSIKPVGVGNLHISGRVRSEPQLECSRCLKRFAFRIDVALDIDLAPMSAMGTAQEHELAGGELDMEFYQGDEIEPLDYIKEQMLISLPMVPLHAPDCKGLCPSCGTDLNIRDCGCREKRGEFGAFSVLKDLLKK